MQRRLEQVLWQLRGGNPVNRLGVGFENPLVGEQLQRRWRCLRRLQQLRPRHLAQYLPVPHRDGGGPVSHAGIFRQDGFLLGVSAAVPEYRGVGFLVKVSLRHPDVDAGLGLVRPSHLFPYKDSPIGNEAVDDGLRNGNQILSTYIKNTIDN